MWIQIRLHQAPEKHSCLDIGEGGVLLIWIIVGQGSAVLAVSAGEVGHSFFYFLSSFSLSLGKGPI